MLSNSGVNKVILIGIANGPFEKKTFDGVWFCCFYLITAEQIKKGNDYNEHFEHHSIRVPEKLITRELADLKNGVSLFIEGRIVTTSYIDEHRIKRYNLNIVANKIDLLDGVDVNLIK